MRFANQCPALGWQWFNPYQPGEAVFRSILLPEDIDWKAFPAFPSSVRMAVVVGDGFAV